MSAAPSITRRIVVMGAGAWGTAVAMHCAKHPDTAQHTTLLCRSDAAARAMRATRANAKYLPGQRFPDALDLTGATETACLQGADLAVIATPVAGVTDALRLVQALNVRAAVWLCKGLDAQTGRLPHEMAAQLALNMPLGVLSGPSFAKEVAQGLPAAMTVASEAEGLCVLVQQAVHHSAMRVYTSSDVLGVEVGGAVKNVIALACGISDGLGLGLNARAALITRGLSEMIRFAVALGAKADTLMGLTGMGDLVLTCTGSLSRNRSYGLLLAQGMAPAAIEAELGHVAEGARCVAAVATRALAMGIDMPITAMVAQVVAGQIAPKDAVAALLTRQAKAE